MKFTRHGLLLLFLLIFMTCQVQQLAIAQEWKEYENNPVITMGDHRIILIFFPFLSDR